MPNHIIFVGITILRILKNEISSTNTLYALSDKSENDIVKENVTFCKKYNIPVEDFVVPFMHMIPKFHKPTTKMWE